MQKYLLVIAIAFGLTAAVSADTIKATVNGMVCGFCATGIEKTFRAQPEVKAVDVDLDNKLVTIHTKQGQTIDDTKIKKIARQLWLFSRENRQRKIMNLRTIALEVLTILSSFSTLLCCALPALLVSLGAGAALASVVALCHNSSGFRNTRFRYSPSPV